MSVEDDREHLHRILLDFRVALDSQSPARLTALLSKYTTTSDLGLGRSAPPKVARELSLV